MKRGQRLVAVVGSSPYPISSSGPDGAAPIRRRAVVGECRRAFRRFGALERPRPGLVIALLLGASAVFCVTAARRASVRISLWALLLPWPVPFPSSPVLRVLSYNIIRETGEPRIVAEYCELGMRPCGLFEEVSAAAD